MARSDVWGCGRCARRPQQTRETAETCRLHAGFSVLRRQLAGHLFSQRINLWGAQAATAKTQSSLPSTTAKTVHLKSKCSHPCRPTTLQW